MDFLIYLIFLSFLIFIIFLNRINNKFFWKFNYFFTFLIFIIFIIFSATIFFLWHFLCSIFGFLGSILILFLLHEKFRKDLIKILHINIDSKNPYHYFAFLLFLSIFFASIISFLLSGETGEGLFGTKIEKITIVDVVINEIFYFLIAIFGIGYLTRKNLKTTLKDLGLKKPALLNILTGFSVGITLILLVTILSAIFQYLGFVNENIDWTKNFINIQNAFILGISAGICEEILFRGALQPKFGILLTALFFAFLHVQYHELWMLFIIFIIGAVLGYVRKFGNTTTSIIAHSTYDIVQMLMLCFVK